MGRLGTTSQNEPVIEVEFADFRSTTAYVDIETTGLILGYDNITTISLYDGNSVRCYVAERNLNQFIDDLQSYSIIVSYNGKCFDVPFIEKQFNVTLNQHQLDLRYILKRLGYAGGLKSCERQIGIDRGNLAEVDGYFAVLLWHEYATKRNEKALETLLAYNIEDVVNLEKLMVFAYNMNLENTPFLESNGLPIPEEPRRPFEPNSGIIRKIKRNNYY